jgi:thiamine-phosphate pyrophosphorylase
MRRVGRLHVLTDVARQSRFDHAELARLALAGGADAIQFREKSGPTRGMIEIARALAGICRDRGACLIVNDRLDVALAADADGVHLGLDDFPPSLARAILGADRVIGASARTVEEAIEGMRAGADYIGAGPVYATGSKPDASPPIGAAGLRAIVRAVEIPVIAIGGVTAERVAEILAAGAHGIAVIEAVAGDPDPAAAARRLREALDAPAAGRG